MSKVQVMDHPLIQHKISLLRDKNTGTNEFRQLVDESAPSGEPRAGRRGCAPTSSCASAQP